MKTQDADIGEEFHPSEEANIRAGNRPPQTFPKPWRQRPRRRGTSRPSGLRAFESENFPPIYILQLGVLGGVGEKLNDWDMQADERYTFHQNNIAQK